MNIKLSRMMPAVTPTDATAARGTESETRGFVRDAFILNVSSMTATIGQMAQIALFTHLLNLHDYGVFALTVASVAIVSRFFDAQVGSAAIAFAARVIDDPREVGSIFRFSYQVDGVSGVAGYAVLTVVALTIGDRLAGSGGRTLFLIYGLTLLTSAVETTALALLQLTNRFAAILKLTVLRELLRVGLLAAVLMSFPTLRNAVIALVGVEAVFCCAAFVTASVAFHGVFGADHALRRAKSMTSDMRRAMLGMIFHTNFIAYAKLISSQLPTILLGVFRTPAEVGAFKVAMALAAGVGKPADPAWAAVLPRLTRLWNEGRGREMRLLLAQATGLAVIVLAAGATGVIAFRDELVKLLAGQSSSAAVNVLLLGVAAQLLSGALFWNSALLIAARKARLASRSYLASAVVLLMLLPALTRAFGAGGAAAALLVSTIIGNALLTVSALGLLRQPTSRTPSPPGHPASPDVAQL